MTVEDPASEARLRELREKIQAVTAATEPQSEEEAQPSWWARYGFWIVTIVAMLKLGWYLAAH